MKIVPDNSHANDISDEQETYPWWLPFLVAAVLGGTGFAALRKELDEPLALWFIGGSAAFGFVWTGLIVVLQRVTIQVDVVEAGMALVVGAIAIFFGVGVTSDPQFGQVSIGTQVGMIVITLWLAAMSTAGLGASLKFEWGVRGSEVLWGLTAVALLVILASFAPGLALQTMAGALAPTVGEVLAVELLFIWGAFGLWTCLSAKRGSRLTAAHTALFWPFLVLVSSPFITGLFAVTIGVFSGGGELLGRAVGVPMVGAFTGLAVLIGLIVVIRSDSATAPE